MLLQSLLRQIGPLALLLEVIGKIFSVEEGFLDHKVHLLEVIWKMLTDGAAGSNEDSEPWAYSEPEGRMDSLHLGESASDHSPPSGVGSSA